MTYVVDVSIALCWVIHRPLTPEALRLRDEYRQALHHLIASSSFSAEVASAFTKSERQKLIPVGHARRLLADILGDAPLRSAPLPGHGHLFSDPQRCAGLSVGCPYRAGAL